MAGVRIVIAAALGALVGWAGPSWAVRALAAVISSAADTLSWLTVTAGGWVWDADSAPLAVGGALAAALGAPALLMVVAEASRASRSARTCATLVLVALALVSFAAAATDTLPFAWAALAIAGTLALTPARWTAVPVAFSAAAVAACWAGDLFGEREWVQAPAHTLASVAGGPVSTWVLVLCLVSAVPFVTTARFLFISPKPSED